MTDNVSPWPRSTRDVMVAQAAGMAPHRNPPLATLLWSFGDETLGVIIFALQCEGNSTAAAAVAVLSMLQVLILSAVNTSAHTTCPRGTVPWWLSSRRRATTLRFH
ncbi:MAG: hypothetical protein QE484_17305 [Rhizobium sp.]|nr:hypothetical protein [Rhizobium sp.]